MNDLKAFLENLGAAKLMVLLGAALISFAFLGYLMLQTTKPDMSLLFAELDSADAGRIVDRLESMGIEYEMRGNGGSIYVPSTRVARIRMDLAQAGLPGSGSIGYEIFDRSDVLGISSAIMDINLVRALEGEISKSIQSIKGVSAARVHLVMPKNEVFARDRTEPSASIMLKMNHGRLSGGQVQGIQHLVAAAVPNLTADKITIVDDRGSLLARENEEGGFDAGTSQEYKQSFEQKLSSTLENLLQKTLGQDKARVEVSADMDFDRVTINAEEFNPDGQVARSTTTIGENATSSEQGMDGSVSVQNALPDNKDAGAGGGGTKSNNKTNHNEENTQFEISKTIRTQIKEFGAIKRLSVAVLVDGVYGKDGKYTPRKKEELDQLTTLMKTAMGFNADRGDVIEVINMPFAVPDAIPEPSTTDKLLAQISLGQILNVALPGLIGLLVFLLFVKPYVMRILDEVRREKEEIEDQPDLSLTPPAMIEPPQVEPVESLVPPTSSSATQIREMIDHYPDETVGIIRNWMASSAKPDPQGG